MDLTHPIDAEVRRRLGAANVNQTELSVAIGRSQGWISRYIDGEGKATIDDVIRIVAALIGGGSPALTETERRLVRALRQIGDPEIQGDVLDYAEHRARVARRAQSKESSAPASGTPPATTRKAHGKR